MTSISRAPFGSLAGKAVDLYTLTADDGSAVSIMTYGGVLTSWSVPDRAGRPADITLGFESLAGYLQDEYLAAGPYFGALIGPCGNRIGGATFSLDGVDYKLAANNGPNNLHSGPMGFHRRVWDAAIEAVGGDDALALRYLSADGEEGFPGNLAVKVLVTLKPGNVLTLDYAATTDKPTIVNMTQHSYFNLAGEGSGDILGTQLRINASRFTPVDGNLIPTGELRDVAGTAFDFREPTTLGASIGRTDGQLAISHGYDHNWVLDRSDAGMFLAASAYEPVSGRLLEVLTTEPGIQFYSGNYLSGALVGKSGRPYARYGGFCLETQHYPDSPNKPGFPSVVLRPGQAYSTRTVYRIAAVDEAPR